MSPSLGASLVSDCHWAAPCFLLTLPLAFLLIFSDLRLIESGDISLSTPYLFPLISAGVGVVSPSLDSDLPPCWGIGEGGRLCGACMLAAVP